MPDPRLLIIADAHIGTPPPESEAALLEFLETAPSLGDALLVAGDLFEFWFAYRRTIPARAFAIAAALARLARAMPVAMVGGNHDRWGRPFWAREAGISWAPRELVCELIGRKTLAIHGDGLVERPGRAAWTQRIVGHPWTSASFGLLHPDLGLALIERLRPLLSSESTRSIEEKHRRARLQRQWAEARLAADPSLDLIVMGHTHVPAAHQPDPGRWYINPGAWFDGWQYACLGRAGAELLRFSRAAPLPPPTAAHR